MPIARSSDKPYNESHKSKPPKGIDMAKTTDSSQPASSPQALKLKKLTLEQVRRIDEVLASLEEYGEVHLVVQNGELRYINKVESFKAWKDKPER